MKKLWQIVEKIVGLYRWHPKIALRYLPICDFIHQLHESVSIVEVGSGGLGIAPYIKQQVIGVDIDFSGPTDDRLVGVYASGLGIPFADNSFDVGISMDMLEHIPAKDRSFAIAELLRVSKKIVCIGVPCGELSERQDAEIARDYEQKKHTPFFFLQQHLEYGLPRKAEMIGLIEKEAQKLGKSITIETKGNIQMNLRKFLMNGWLSEGVLSNIFFRKILLLAIPLMRLWNQEPTYRQLFMVTLKS